MQLVKQTKSLYKTLSQDENLLRLLFYMPEHINDDVLDNRRPDILKSAANPLSSGVSDSQPEKLWDIIADRIKMTRKVDDLTDANPKCRVCVYLGDMEKGETNHLSGKQYIVVDVICHEKFQNIDLRAERIIERVNKILFGHRTGFGKNNFEGMKLLEDVVEGANYRGYEIIFSTGSWLG